MKRGRYLMLRGGPMNVSKAMLTRAEWSRAAIRAPFLTFPRGYNHTLRVTPAMEAGVSNHVWDLSEVVALIDAAEELVKLAA